MPPPSSAALPTTLLTPTRNSSHILMRILDRSPPLGLTPLSSMTHPAAVPFSFVPHLRAESQGLVRVQAASAISPVHPQRNRTRWDEYPEGQ